MDAFADIKVHFEIETSDFNYLFRNAFDVDLNAADLVVIESVVLESPQVEVAAKLAIYATEQIEIKGGG